MKTTKLTRIFHYYKNINLFGLEIHLTYLYEFGDIASSSTVRQPPNKYFNSAN